MKCNDSSEVRGELVNDLQSSAITPESTVDIKIPTSHALRASQTTSSKFDSVDLMHDDSDGLRRSISHTAIIASLFSMIVYFSFSDGIRNYLHFLSALIGKIFRLVG